MHTSVAILEALAESPNPNKADCRKISAIVNARLGQNGVKENCDPEMVYRVRYHLRATYKAKSLTHKIISHHLNHLKSYHASRRNHTKVDRKEVSWETIMKAKEFLESAGSSELAHEILNVLTERGKG